MPLLRVCESSDAVQCSQRYYDLNKSARDQGEVVSQEVSNSIFDELMSEEDDSWQEGDALDVVPTLDQDPLEVEQYEATDFESEDQKKLTLCLQVLQNYTAQFHTNQRRLQPMT